jgi:hypothetical protein
MRYHYAQEDQRFTFDATIKNAAAPPRTRGAPGLLIDSGAVASG